MYNKSKSGSETGISIKTLCEILLNVAKISALGPLFIHRHCSLTTNTFLCPYVPFYLSYVPFCYPAHGFGGEHTVGLGEKPQSLCRDTDGERHEHNSITQLIYTRCLL